MKHKGYTKAILFQLNSVLKLNITKMPLKVPPDLKKITQYIRRAEELDNDKSPQTRIVAYYCRQHAVQVGIPLVSTPAARECLGEILNELEKEKKAMSSFTKEEGYQLCREFAMKVFDKADAVDRAGKSTKATAKSFYAAASFLDVLSHFHEQGGEKSEDVLEEEKKSFYAKWKATDILKAIREGKEVKPGGYGEEPQEEEVEVGGDDGGGMGMGNNMEQDEPAEAGTEVSINDPIPPPPPYSSTQQPIAPPINHEPDPVSMPVPVPAPTKRFGMFGGGGGKGKTKYSKAVLGDAKELTKFALKALSEKDGDLAIQRLQEALNVLSNA